MRTKRIITRVILSAAAAGSIATGVSLPLATVAAPASGVVAISQSPNMIIHQG